MREVFKLVGKITMDGAEYVQKSLAEIDKQSVKTSKSLYIFGDNVSSAGNTLGKFAKGAGVVGLALGAVAIGVKKAVDEAVQFADGIKKTADQMQMTTTETQEWDYVLRQAGSSINNMTGSMQKMQDTAYEAYEGNEKAKESFDLLGVSLTDANGNLKTSGALFKDTVLALTEIENPTQRAALAQDVFGKSAKDLLPILSQSREEILQQIDNASKYGQVLSEEAVKALDDAGDMMENFSNAMKVAGAEIVTSFAPAITTLSETATKAASFLADIGRGLQWILKGKKEFDAKMKESDAITKEIQELAKLKKEMENVVATQNSFKAHKSVLFDQDTLDSAKETIRAINEELHNINGGGKPNNAPVKKAPKAVDEKELEKQLKKRLEMEKRYQDQVDDFELSALQKADKRREESLKEAGNNANAKANIEKIYTHEVEGFWAEMNDNIAKEDKENLDEFLKNSDSKKDAVEEWEKKIAAVNETEFERDQRLMDEEVKAAEKNEGLIYRIKKYYQEKIRQDLIEHVADQMNMYADYANQLTGSISQIYDNQIAKIDQVSQKEIEKINNSKMSEKDKADAITKINEDADKKKRALQRKQAKLEKVTGIFEVGINTAVSIMKAYAQLGPIGGTIMAILLAAIGAVQTAAIASKPIPMAKGAFVPSQEGGVSAVVGEGKQDEIVFPLQTGVNLLANDLLDKLMSIKLPSFAGNSGVTTQQFIENNTRPLSVSLTIGTFIGDENGLKQLERKLSTIRISESQRKGNSDLSFAF
jgi:hypothetical protein